MFIILILFIRFVNRFSDIFGVFMTFFERLQDLLDSRNLSQKQLAESINVRQNTISDWKNKGNLPQGETAIKLAQYFNVSLDYLLTGEDKNNELSPDEIELLSLYKPLSRSNKLLLKGIITTMTNIACEIKPDEDENLILITEK